MCSRRTLKVKGPALGSSPISEPILDMQLVQERIAGAAMDLLHRHAY
jgi:hypothetical protein